MPPDAPALVDNPTVNRRKRKDLTPSQRQFVIDQSLRNLKHGDDGKDEINGKLVLLPGVTKKLAIKLDVNETTVRRVWKRACKAYYAGKDDCFKSESNKKNSGPKQKYNREEIASEIKLIPFAKRGTIRNVARALGLPKSTVHRIAKDKRSPDVIFPHANAIKPRLTEENRMARLLYAINHLQLNHVDQVLFNNDTMDPGKFGYYDGFFDVVHIDEKWFFVSRAKQRIYLTKDEIGPHRTVSHKSHIEKVMFLSAVARPRYDEHGVCVFDGKIGIWPFVKQAAAQRASANRPRGTMVTTCVTVTKAVYTAMIINNVIPAIREKWPDDNKTVYIQHDNAKTHFKADDAAFLEAGAAMGWNITLTPQPPNSPDTNINDLSFFRALQSCQWGSVEEAKDDKDSLIAAVKAAYEDFDHKKINRSFLTLATCLEEIIQSHGDNRYKIPHIGKERLERLGQLPVRIEASELSIEIASDFLDAQEGSELDDYESGSELDDYEPDYSNESEGNQNNSGEEEVD
jgi:hypothetical protein